MRSTTCWRNAFANCSSKSSCVRFPGSRKPCSPCSASQRLASPAAMHAWLKHSPSGGVVTSCLSESCAEYSGSQFLGNESTNNVGCCRSVLPATPADPPGAPVLRADGRSAPAARHRGAVGASRLWNRARSIPTKICVSDGSLPWRAHVARKTTHTLKVRTCSGCATLRCVRLAPFQSALKI